MNEVVAPLKQGNRGARVSDLQDALRWLVERGLLLKDDDEARLSFGDVARAGLGLLLAHERQSERFGKCTAKLVRAFQRENGLEGSGEVDARTAALINAAVARSSRSSDDECTGEGPKTEPPRTPPGGSGDGSGTPPEFQYLVRGQVLYRGGLPIPDLIVRAFHRELRADVELGTGRTDSNGNFEIYYNPATLDGCKVPLNDRPPDLFVRVSQRVPNEDPAEKVLAESPTRFAAQRIVKFRLLVDGGPSKIWSEFEQLSQEVQAHLGDVRIEDLTEDSQHQDITLLAGKLAQDPVRLATFVAAHRMAAEVEGEPEVFYGLLRKGLPSNLSEMLAVPPAARSRALVAAIREGVAPGHLVGKVRQVRRQFEQYSVTFAAADKETAGRPRLGALVKTAVSDRGKADALVARMLSHKGPARQLWESLREDKALAPIVGDAQLSLQLAALTGRHLPLVNTLIEQKRKGRFDGIADLADLSQADWLELINAPGVDEDARVPPAIPGKTPEERANVYAETLTRIVADALPTRILARKLQSDESRPADVQAFWKNVAGGAAGFELGRGPVRSHIEANPELLKGVRDKEVLYSHLDEAQRLFTLTRNHDEQEVLRANGLNSSLAIARLGQGAFLQRVSGTAVTPQKGVLIYERASRVSAAALDLATRYSPAFNQLVPKVVAAPKLNQMPNLETLFGTFSFCACDQCRSVHGAAAYLADLLAFLGDRDATAPGDSALDVLLDRRPDLGELELTCANTNTVLPYTDLVNEILERRIAPFKPFNLPAASAAELDDRTLSDAVRTAFGAKGITLAENARVIVGIPAGRWSITDGSTLYSIAKAGANVKVTGAWPQTGASAATLASVPEHRTAAAYETLAKAVYPWTLPLDLPTEEVRTFLGHLGSSRHELMAELFPSGPAAALDNVQIAAEYLGLSDVERQYIAGQVQAPNPEFDPWEYWGLNQNGNAVRVFDAATKAFADKPLGWLEAIAWVRQMMRRSGLDYELLIRILGCDFVNPDRKVRVVSADPDEPATCDTAKLVLTNLTAPVADRLSRFVRLWRKIGGEPEELDRILVSLCASKLDNAAMVKVSHVVRLKAGFGRNVDEIVALWAPLPRTGRDPLYQRLFLNADILNPLDPAFALDANGEIALLAAKPAQALVSLRASAVIAALRISAADLAALQAGGVAGDDKLSIANLSHLYRHALLAELMQIGIPDLLLLKKMAGENPFSPAATGNVQRFIDLGVKIRQSQLEIGDLAYLLFHHSPETASLAPPLGALAELVAHVRRQLKLVRDATEPRADPSGEHLRRELAALRWPESLIDEAVALLDGTKAFTTALDPAPAAFAIPADFAGRLAHDPVAKTLTLTGSLTAAEQALLKGAFPEAAYKAAIDDMFEQPRNFAKTFLRAYSWPVFSAPLAALPAGLTFPAALRPRVNYDPAAARLTFEGLMTVADQAALDALSANAAYRSATAALLAASNAFSPADDNRFFTAAVANSIFAKPLASDRLEAALALVLAHRRTGEGTRLVIRLLADSTGMKERLAETLLTRDIRHPDDPLRAAIEAFLEEPFAASAVDVRPDEATFPAVFEVAARMTKIAALVGQMRLSDRVIARILGPAGDDVVARPSPWPGSGFLAKWLKLTDLPPTPTPINPARFAAWVRLVDLAGLGRSLPGGDITAEAVFAEARKAGATPASVIARLAAETGWEATELSALAAALGLALPGDLADEFGLSRLRDAARRLRRLNTDSAQAQAWIEAAPDEEAGLAARRAVQASYGAEKWPDAIRPLEDVLREKRRAALVAYLVARPDPALGEAWTDTNGMYAHLLIDVETQPVVLTSRLKQAIGSVQLFVQRCLMNLEPAVVADETKDIGWRQWPWMKQYRVWEANRKIFLYPENWIEPELRDDKSPFFLELENGLLQSDVTAESAEKAYRTYLERVDEVARLSVAGLFHQPGEGGAPDELHVFARTQADPPAYFYRKWIGQARWTPWERLELDIPGGQIIPLMWNRRLYLFWPIFTRKADAPPSGGDKPAAGKPYFEIQLAWSEYRQGRWGSKKTSPPDVTLRSKIVPDSSRDEGRSKHVFRANIAGSELQIWYESVDSVATQVGKYGEMLGGGGALATDGWRFSGCNGRVTIFQPFNVGVFPPPNTHASGMGFEEGRNETVAGPFGMKFTFPVSDGTVQLPKGLTGTDTAVVLRRTPGAEPFRLMAPHQERYLTGRLPFFFQDDSQTLFVVPKVGTEWTWVWAKADSIDTKLVDAIDKIYYQADPIPDPIGPVEQRWDPVPLTKVRFTDLDMAGNEKVIPVADGLAEPIVPAMPTAGLEFALRARKAEVAKHKAGGRRTVSAVGDRKVIEVAEFLRPDRMFKPIYIGGHSASVRRYEFRIHYHPYVCPMIRELNLRGVEGMLRRPTQMLRATPFEGRYGPTSLVEMGNTAKKDRYPVENVDFDFDGAYAPYNWELFFHAPLLIATKLSQNQRFEEAQKWFHTIFDPTDTSGAPVPAKYWRTRPFFEEQEYQKARIDKLLEALAKGQPDEEFSRQLSEWIANPFRPFAVARVRTVAFQKSVVMKYLDNLIAWGDQLFRRDTIESINEATQLYILAAEILGPRPPVVAPRATPETHTFNTLAPQFEALTGALTSIEVVTSSPRIDAVLASPDSPPLPVPQLLYFCVPPNDKLLGYWDVVADRLFKIRNSLNLAGIRRTLPLFEPPIDPMLLVKAAAAGVDLSSAIADLAAPAPHYRFSVLVQKALELGQEVKALGAALLGALERRDAEELSRIQMVNEIAVLNRLTAVKEEQINEAAAQTAALEAAREVAAERYRHYMRLLGTAPTIPPQGSAPPDAEAVPGASTLQRDGVRMIAQETNELTNLADAHEEQNAAADSEHSASIASAFPSIGISATPWGVGISTGFGGPNIAAMYQAGANRKRTRAEQKNNDAGRAARFAHFILRAHDWQFEANMAAREIARIDRDIAAAQIRVAVATTERDSHLQQVEEQRRVDEYLRTKYTNRELYEWMVGQISAVYFQSYQLAYDGARRAERAFRRELAQPDSNFIRFGYWDSLRKGLLAGDRLIHDIRRMEMAYLAQNAREYEIVKHVSLAGLNPEGLLALQEKGACFLDLPEAIFDLDHPGHYLRRIKAVTVTVACVTGSYTSVPLKLTLLANRTRVDPRPTPQYPVQGPEDRRFEFNSGGLQSVVTSTGRDDPGAFELNLRDERYLPFEGAGVISSWRLELPADLRPFDYRTISDVVLHVRYTARDGGEMLRAPAAKQLAAALKAMEVEQGRTGLTRGFSLRYQFVDSWQAFAHMPDGQPGDPVLNLTLSTDHFPIFSAGRAKIVQVAVALIPAPGVAYDDADRMTLAVTPPTGAAQALTLFARPGRAGSLPVAETAALAPVAVKRPEETNKAWKIEVTHIPANFARTVSVNGADVKRIDPSKVADIAVLVAFTT